MVFTRWNFKLVSKWRKKMIFWSWYPKWFPNGKQTSLTASYVVIGHLLIKPKFTKRALDEFDRIKSKEGKAKTGYSDSQCGFCGCVALSKPSNYSFALTILFFKYNFSCGKLPYHLRSDPAEFWEVNGKQASFTNGVTELFWHTGFLKTPLCVKIPTWPPWIHVEEFLTWLLSPNI